MTGKIPGVNRRQVRPELEPDVAPPPGAIVFLIASRTAYYETAAGHRHEVPVPAMGKVSELTWNPFALAVLKAQTWLDMHARALNRPLFIFGMESKNVRGNGEYFDEKGEADDEDE